MGHLNLHTLRVPQRTIKVSVEFYDADEKAKLLKYPTAAVMSQMVRDGIEVPTEEFLTYYLFYKRRPGKAGWRSYPELGAKIGHAIAELDDWLEFTGKSIVTPADLGTQDKAISERIGESIGMSVVSRIHGLTNADWDRIDTHGGPGGFSTFDFQIASDGIRIVQLETKGSSIPVNTKKASTVSNHKRDIHDKKEAIATRELQMSYPYPADVRYGTITVVGEQIDSPVKCLLVDPPSHEQQGLAKKLRLIQRQIFLRDWITLLSPRSQLASALQTRLSSLRRLPDPYILDGLPLLKGNGENFDFSPQGYYGVHSTFFASKAKISDGPSGGVTVTLPDGDLFFLGIREDLLALAARQQFSEILEYKSQVGSMEKEVECVFSAQAFRGLKLSSAARSNLRPYRDGYYHFSLKGEIHYADSGILFGVLPLTQLESPFIS